LRANVLDVASDLAPTLGFDPSVRFEGPVDTVSTPEITDNVIAVVREALTNTARHARATAVNVTIAAADEFVVTIADDGTGADEFSRPGGNGVSNLAERARSLGGDATVESVAPHGTRVEWRVPTPR
jgi:signal transduction histidine kinase